MCEMVYKMHAKEKKKKGGMKKRIKTFDIFIFVFFQRLCNSTERVYSKETTSTIRMRGR